MNPVICKKPLLPYHFLAYVVRAENSILISKVKNAEALPEPLPTVTQLRDVEPRCGSWGVLMSPFSSHLPIWILEVLMSTFSSHLPIWILGVLISLFSSTGVDPGGF